MRSFCIEFWLFGLAQEPVERPGYRHPGSRIFFTCPPLLLLPEAVLHAHLLSKVWLSSSAARSAVWTTNIANCLDGNSMSTRSSASCIARGRKAAALLLC